MPKFHSLRPLHPLRIDDEPREPSSAFHTQIIEDPFNQNIEQLPRDHGTQTFYNEYEQHFQAEPISRPLYSVQPAQSNTSITTPTTPRMQALSSRHMALQTSTEKALQPYSLITALQLTMEPKTNRTPVVIPAVMKKTKQLPVTEALSPTTRRTISRFKLGIVLGAMTAFLFLTAFSLGPASQGKDTLPLVGNAIQWMQGQQQGLSMVSQTAPAIPVTQNTTQPIVAAPAMPAIPQSDLVTLAQQDAIKYGISPVYFVRQIYAESGFNVNAYSPAGAVGIAQFLPSTAAGLGIDPYDPVSALDGAAKYMAGLSNQFGGDYAKALAAYNAGSGAVQTAVNNAGANWLSLMPYETQVYVNKIIG
jgi:Transglycosylase SLT domain